MSRYCSLVLHAHVPWVRNPEVDRCLEEDWYFGALAECYVPLLEMLYQLREDEIPFRLTINLSPPLLYLLRDRMMTRRALAYFDRTIKLCEDECERGESTGFGELARLYLFRFQTLRSAFVDQFNCDLVGALINLHQSGHVELTASAATHGVLPLLMKVPESVSSQIRVGLSEFEKTFGFKADGFWLPECAFAPALSRILVKQGIKWTLVEQHGLTHLNSTTSSIFPHRPAQTVDGLRVFSRDNEASQTVWNAESGYPADPRYRDYFRDIGIEAPLDLLSEYLDGSEIRRFTGLKFFRRSGGALDKKEIYNPNLAHQALEENSVHFVNSRGAQLASLEARGISDPIVVCAFDASLFGHWWFEGVEFLNRVFRKAADRKDFKFITPGEYQGSTPLPVAMPVSSSWGEGGFFETWMSESNNWINSDLFERGSKLCRMVQTHRESRDGMSQDRKEHRERCLRQLSRDLLMAQASDWGFLLNNEASFAYAGEKVRGYLDSFDSVWKVCTSFGDLSALDEIEKRYPIFSDISWDLFLPQVSV